MKHSKSFFVFIALLLAGTIFAQVLPDSSQLAALELFRERYGNEWFVRFDPVTGLPASAFGSKTPSFGRCPETAARGFLYENKDLFKIQSGRSALRMVSAAEIKGTTLVKFRQVYKEIPVAGAEYIV